jgi:hypothetical protein
MVIQANRELLERVDSLPTELRVGGEVAEWNRVTFRAGASLFRTAPSTRHVSNGLEQSKMKNATATVQFRPTVSWSSDGASTR